MIPVYKTYIPKASAEYANDAISSTWISSLGKYIELATEELKSMCQTKYILLTNNGTSATHLVCKALKRFEPKAKRILVPSACYVAVYNSLIYDNNNWEILCVDLSEKTWNMEIDEIEEGDVIFAVHNLGNIINVPRLIKEYNCPVIEDNCEGVFGFYEKHPSGSKSLCSSISFFGNKNITCGEGGALLTNDENLYNFAKKLRGQGQSSERYIHDELGYNYRMTNIQAALLLGQLENRKYISDNKERVFERYKNKLKNVDGIKLQHTESGTKHSNWMFGVRIHGLRSYNLAKTHFEKLGVDTRPMFYPHTIHNHINFTGECKTATLLNKEIIIFPSYPKLLDSEIDYICDSVINFVQKEESLRI